MILLKEIHRNEAPDHTDGRVPQNFSLGPDPWTKFGLVDRVLTKGKTGLGCGP